MRVLVTGGAGFIGSHIVDALLAAGHEAAALDNLSTGDKANLPSDVPLYEVDIRDDAAVAQAFDDFRPEAVSHQAAQMSVSKSMAEPKYDAECNILGLLNVLQNAQRVDANRFVFASSGGVLYGDVETPADESHPADPISPYGISKWVGEQYLKFFARTHGMTCAAMRYANVYGPRQNPHGEAGVVAIFCKRMLAGDGCTINGDGKYIRDYVFGPDVAQSNVLALTGDLPEAFNPFNVGTAIPTDVNQLGHRLHELIDAKVDRDVPAPAHGPHRDGDLRSSLVDYGKIKSTLGWQPEVKVDDGLAKTVDWFHDAVGATRAAAQ